MGAAHEHDDVDNGGPGVSLVRRTSICDSITAGNAHLRFAAFASGNNGHPGGDHPTHVSGTSNLGPNHSANGPGTRFGRISYGDQAASGHAGNSHAGSLGHAYRRPTPARI